MIEWFKRIFCPHPLVRVIRWHPNVVPRAWKGKELYTDCYGVSNFVQCSLCGHVICGGQQEHLYETKEEE
jgi:hypothetical protein